MLPAGRIVVVIEQEANSSGRQYSLVRLESDEHAPTEWLQSGHVLPLRSGARDADTTRRRLAASLLQGSPPSPATSPTGGRHVREAQNSSGALRPSTVAATSTRHAHNPLDDDDLAPLLQVLPRTAPASACTRRCCVLGSCRASDAQRLLLCAGCAGRRAIADEAGDLCLRYQRLPANDPALQAPWLLPPSVRPMRTEDVSRRGERE